MTDFPQVSGHVTKKVAAMSRARCLASALLVATFAVVGAPSLAASALSTHSVASISKSAVAHTSTLPA